MALFVTFIQGIWYQNYNNGSHFFQRSFAQCLVVSASKVLNDLDKYLLRHCTLKDCLELDVHDMTSRI